MQANPDKFHFMLFSPKPTAKQVLRIRDDTSLVSEAEVKVLGVTIEHKLWFPQHISACCKKAARQLNALARISKHLNINSRRAIYNSFIMSNFNYCPLVWHFCGQVNNQKLEKSKKELAENRLQTITTLSESYRQICNIRRTEFQNLNVFSLVLHLSLPHLFKPCVKSKMKM